MVKRRLNKKRKRKNIILTSIILILLVLGIAYLSLRQSFIPIAIGGLDITPTLIDFNYNGIKGQVETPYLGGLSSDQATKKVICGDNDAGDVSISNTFSSDNNLHFSTTYSQDGSCGGQYGRSNVNGFIGTMQVPAGELEITCSTGANNYENRQNPFPQGLCELKDGTNILFSSSSVGCDATINTCGKGNNKVSKVESISLVFDKPTTISIEITASTTGAQSTYNDARAEATIQFTPSQTSNDSDNADDSNNGQTSDSTTQEPPIIDNSGNNVIITPKKSFFGYIAFGIIGLLIIGIIILIIRRRR